MPAWKHSSHTLTVGICNSKQRQTEALLNNQIKIPHSLSQSTNVTTYMRPWHSLLYVYVYIGVVRHRNIGGVRDIMG